MNEHAQTPAEIIASLEKRLAAMEAEKVNLVTENISLRQLYERAPLAYQTLDSTGCFIEINQAWVDALGYAKEEVLGRNFGDFLHPDWKDHFKENFPRFNAIGEIFGIEIEIVKKDGSTILVSFHGMIGKDPGGQFQQTHCIFQDITERKNAENSLRLRESYLSAIINNLPGLLWLKDRHSKFLAVNTEFSKSCGLKDPELLVGKTDLDIWPKELADKYIADDAEVLKSGKPLVIEEAISDKGEMKWFETFKAPVFGSQEITIGTTGYAREITERKRAEEVLKESEERLQLVMDGSQLGYWDWNIVTGEVRRNKHWAGMLGYTLKEIEDSVHQWTDLHHPDDRAAAWQSINDHLEGKTPAHRIEYRMRAKNGQYRWILDQARVVKRNSEGKPTRMSGTHTDITELKQAEEAVIKTNNLLQTIINTAPVRIFYKDRDLRYMGCNNAFAKDAGVTNPEDLIGKDDYQLAWKEQAELYRTDDLRVLESGIPKLSYDEPQTTSEGKQIWLRTSKVPLLNDSNEIIGVLGMYEDISDRKKAEEALLESENQISSIFRSAPVGIGSVVNRVLRKVNNRLCEMTGYDETELIGQSARMLYSSDEDFEYVGQEKYAQITDHGTGTVETRLQKHDGTIIDVLLSSTPVDPHNQLKGVTFTVLDITERKRAENNLRMAHERMLTILDGIDSTVYVADMDTYEILFMNQKMITDFGGNKTGDLCYSAFRRNSEPCDCCTNDQLIGKDGNPTGVCIWHDNNPVSGRYYINYDRAIQWNDGRLVRMQNATDITDLKRIETQLHQAQKMESVGRLAGGVAHDFNNMLGAILGYTELALERVESDNPLHANLEKIQGAAQRSANLTRQLLAFARKQTVSPKVIDLNDTIESMLKLLLRLIGEDIDLAWRPGKDVWPVKIDPTQIDQILANLCVNARDAIVDTGKVTIETGIATFDEECCSRHAGFVPGDYVMLAVSDTGCGMDKETQTHLFEPFFTTKEVGKGTGLGLATVYGTVKQNNGFINVYSELGQGTTFKIYLPRHLAKTAPVPEKEPDTTGGRGHETVLLVEDESVILEMTTIMLERLGYTVLAAGTPGEAIRLAQEHPGRIDLLLTDVVMPEMNGRDLARNLLSIYPDIRRLFMSGYTANVIAHHGVLDEGVNFIQKPFTRHDLAAKIREALD